MLDLNSTICAPATIPGTGAISIIRVSGPDTFSIADKVIKCTGRPVSASDGYTIRFGTVSEKDGRLIDEVLVSIFRTPHSYTGEDSIELSCHASRYIAGRIIERLMEEGCTLAGPGEFTKRAYINGKMDLAQAEAVADVISSSSEASHRIAISQMKGGFSRELAGMRDALLKITSLMELELDFSEEEVEFADRTQLRDLITIAIAHCDRLVGSFRAGNAIKNGIPTAIAGSTNSGKSTLLNTILGEERAITSDIPGTTRDTIEEVINLDGHNFRFIDTAGIRQTDETIEKIGIERTIRSITGATIILGVVDATLPLTVIKHDIETILGNIDPATQKLILCLNKTDKTAGTDRPSRCDIKKDILAGLPDGTPVLEISALKGTGIDQLRDELSRAGSALHNKYANENQGETLVTSLRHLQALKNTSSALTRALDALTAGLPGDLVSQDLRQAIHHLGSITGDITTDEVLGEIFGRFCIGK